MPASCLTQEGVKAALCPGVSALCLPGALLLVLGSSWLPETFKMFLSGLTLWVFCSPHVGLAPGPLPLMPAALRPIVGVAGPLCQCLSNSVSGTPVPRVAAVEQSLQASEQGADVQMGRGAVLVRAVPQCCRVKDYGFMRPAVA